LSDTSSNLSSTRIDAHFLSCLADKEEDAIAIRATLKPYFDHGHNPAEATNAKSAGRMIYPVVTLSPDDPSLDARWETIFGE
jgi:hypothetical protein